MNLASYEKSLQYAKNGAKLLGVPYVVHVWAGDENLKILPKVDATSLDAYLLISSPARLSFLVATVMPDGEVSESAWIKAQLEAVAA